MIPSPLTGNLTMVGTLGYDKAGRRPYVEKVYNSGKLETTVEMMCQYAGDGVP
jgi:hypothetical protein